MLKKSLSIIVALYAVFFGIIWYHAYLAVSPKLEGYQKLIPFLFNLNNEMSKILADTFGLLPRYKWFRWFFSAISAPNIILEPDTNGISIKNTFINGVPVKIFHPTEERVGETIDRPGLIYFHGGGLVFGSVNWTGYTKQCIMLAQDTKSVVISVEYRLAPEYPFPAQFEDCYSVVNAVCKESTKYGILNKKIAVAGDSSGGQIAAAVSIELAKQNRSSELVGQVLIYPLLQYMDVLCLQSYQENKHGFQMDEEQSAYFMSIVTMENGDMKQDYLDGKVTGYFMKTPFWKFLEIPKTSNCDVYKKNANISLPQAFVKRVTDPHMSPLLAQNLKGSPSTLLVIAEYDILASEGILYGKRLERENVPTVIKTYKTYHVFLQTLSVPFNIDTTIAKQGMQDIADFLNTVFYK